MSNNIKTVHCVFYTHILMCLVTTLETNKLVFLDSSAVLDMNIAVDNEKMLKTRYEV